MSPLAPQTKEDMVEKSGCRSVGVGGARFQSHLSTQLSRRENPHSRENCWALPGVSNICALAVRAKSVVVVLRGFGTRGHGKLVRVARSERRVRALRPIKDRRTLTRSFRPDETNAIAAKLQDTQAVPGQAPGWNEAVETGM